MIQDYSIEEIAWLAGLLEGEGCFGITCTPTIWLGMCDEDIVKKVALMFEATCRERKVMPGHSRAYATQVCGEKGKQIMLAILPYMGIRRSAKIREVLELAAKRKGVREGQGVGTSKLTTAKVIEILNEYHLDSSHGSQTRLAKKYGVTSNNIGFIVRRVSWRHLRIA